MSSRQEFWETMKILVERDFKRNIYDDVKDWMDNIIRKWTTNSEDPADDSVARKRRGSDCSGIDAELNNQVHQFLKLLENKAKNVDCR